MIKISEERRNIICTGYNPINDIWCDNKNDDEDTTGLIVWSSSHILANYIEKNRSIYDLSSVVELGSGTGFMAVLLSTLGARHITATDKSEKALNSITRTLTLNNINNVCIEFFSFGKSDSLPSFFTNATLVIACDVIYLVEQVEDLCFTIKLITCTAMICSNLRSPSLINMFDSSMSKLNLKFEKFQLDDHHVLHIIHPSHQ